jgi:capsular polysaccharide biosynthesis protein
VVIPSIWTSDDRQVSPFENEDSINREIEAIAAAHGFVISYPEDLDFVSQAKLLRDARFVLGPEGSALFLCCFVGRGAKICILNHQEAEGLVLY